VSQVRRFNGVVLIGNIANYLLDEILQSDDASRATVFVEHNRQVSISADLAHVRQRDIDGLTTLEEFSDKVGLVLPEGPYDLSPRRDPPK
jgi:hypothetical protein